MPQSLPPQGVRSGSDTGSTPTQTYDTAARTLFDRTTRLAASLLDVPVAVITIADDDQLHFASCVGPTHPWGSTPGIPLSHSACQHAIRSRQPLLIEDARTDPLVKDSPATGVLGIVAYIGVPLVGSGGNTIGTLCAIDTRPRAWTDEDARVLEDLAATVTAYLEARPAPQQLGSGLNIAAVAQRTGIGADTLRKWERRYGVLRPSRTSGGQRRYDERDVARVEWLRDRLADGFRIGEAAALLETDDASAESSTTGLRDAIVAAVADDGHPAPGRAGRAVVHALRRRDRGRGDRGAGSAARRRPLGGRRRVHRRGAPAQRGRARTAADAPGRPPPRRARHCRPRLRTGRAPRARPALARRPAPGGRLAHGLSRHRHAARRGSHDRAAHGRRSALPERERPGDARGARGRARGRGSP